MSLGLHWDILKPSIETFLCQLSQHWNHFVISVQLGMKSLVVAALVHQRNPSPIWSSTVNARFRCVSFVNMCNYTTHPPYGRQSHHAMSQLDPPALYPPALEGPTLEGNLLTACKIYLIIFLVFTFTFVAHIQLLYNRGSLPYHAPLERRQRDPDITSL